MLTTAPTLMGVMVPLSLYASDLNLMSGSAAGLLQKKLHALASCLNRISLLSTSARQERQLLRLNTVAYQRGCSMMGLCMHEESGQLQVLGLCPPCHQRAGKEVLGSSCQERPGVLSWASGVLLTVRKLFDALMSPFH